MPKHARQCQNYETDETAQRDCYWYTRTIHPTHALREIRLHARLRTGEWRHRSRHSTFMYRSTGVCRRHDKSVTRHLGGAGGNTRPQETDGRHGSTTFESGGQSRRASTLASAHATAPCTSTVTPAAATGERIGIRAPVRGSSRDVSPSVRGSFQSS